MIAKKLFVLFISIVFLAILSTQHSVSSCGGDSGSRTVTPYQWSEGRKSGSASLWGGSIGSKITSFYLGDGGDSHSYQDQDR